MTLQVGTQRPSFDGATEWLNHTGAHAEHEMESHVTLIHFWAISCAACMDNFARLAEWRDTHAEAGLRIIAVHTPDTKEDADTESVRDAVLENNITEPCAIDNGHALRDRFANGQADLPAYYLFDREEKLIVCAVGKDGLKEIESALEAAIKK